MVDQIFKIGYNSNMKLEINEILQWTGAVFIIAGHSLNAVGPAVYPYNILAFFLGTILFMAWSIRVANKPQLLVNAAQFEQQHRDQLWQRHQITSRTIRIQLKQKMKKTGTFLSSAEEPSQMH